jgi:hypothetical protein
MTRAGTYCFEPLLASLTCRCNTVQNCSVPERTWGRKPSYLQTSAQGHCAFRHFKLGNDYVGQCLSQLQKCAKGIFSQQRISFRRVDT